MLTDFEIKAIIQHSASWHDAFHIHHLLESVIPARNGKREANIDWMCMFHVAYAMGVHEERERRRAAK